MQYTVQGVPAYVAHALRRKAAESRRSLNEVLRDALIKEADGGGRVHADLDAIAGSWVDVPGFDAAFRAQDQVDEALWR